MDNKIHNINPINNNGMAIKTDMGRDVSLNSQTSVSTYSKYTNHKIPPIINVRKSPDDCILRVPPVFQRKIDKRIWNSMG